MSKGLQRALILLVIFVATLIGFSRVINRETADMTTDMPQASLPIVYFENNGRLINELHGYVREMDVVSMRDTVTPFGTGNNLPVRIDTYGKKVDSLSFEVRSLDAGRLIQDTDVALSDTGDTLRAQLEIQNLLEDGTEYQLVIQLHSGKEAYYYYTRIVRNEQAHVQECLDFAEDFHNITMDKNRRDELSSYLEPSAGTDNTSLQKVTIHNRISQAAWADFDGKEITEPVASVKELNENYHVILLNYIMSSLGEDGQSEYYNVEEYYRVRYGEQKMYLLDFERTMEEIFRGDGGSVKGDSIDLGIRSSDVDFKANETGVIVCFVQQGELWSYNLDENELSQVFGFRGAEGMDERENFGEHDIRIVRAGEGGNIDFIVSGYMNRGIHEGQVGVSVCHYDGVTGTVEEQLFIPSDTSYQMLKNNIGETMYISDSGMFYLMMGNQVHRISLETKEDDILLSGIDRDSYKSSDNGRYLAWSEENSAAVLHLTDLETGETYDVSAEEGNNIRPLGFIATECIYGTAPQGGPQGIGTLPYAMSQVNIMEAADSSHDILKTYAEKNVFVTGISIRDGGIYLDRVKKKGSGFENISQEIILNRDMQEKEVVYVAEKESKEKQREVILQLSESVPDGKQRQVVSRLVIPDRSVELDLEDEEAGYAYYVYAKGKILLGTDSVAEAIRSADENGGVVADRSQICVWRRGKKDTCPPLSVSGLPTDGTITYSDVAGSLPDRTVYDLTGCTLEQVLYFVGEGNPVYAVLPDNKTELIVGYDAYNVRIYNAAKKKSSNVRIKEAEQSYTASGNVFYCAVGE